MFIASSVGRRLPAIYQPSRLVVNAWDVVLGKGHQSFRSSAASLKAEAAPAASQHLPGLDDMPAVPSYPFIGSAFAIREANHVGHVKHASDDTYQMLKTFYGKNAPIYTIGMPGLGKGIKGTAVMCCDPEEYLKVIQNEGMYPTGALLLQWPSMSYNKRHNNPISGLWTQGEEWRRYRSFMQKGLMAPAVARSYVPAIAKAAEHASMAMPLVAEEVDTFSSRASFDVFCGAFFGKMMHTADPSTPTDPRNLQFCADVVGFGKPFVEMLLSPAEYVADRIGIRTARGRTFDSLLTSALGHAGVLIEDFVRRREAGELSDYEKRSYLMAALEQHEDGSDLSFNELKELSQVLLASAVDTTSSMVNWTLLSLATNPAAQERLADELRRELGGGDLTEAAVKGRNALPYLNAVVRETHRMRPSIPLSVAKAVSEDTEIHGYNIPAGTRVWLDSYSIQNDPALIPDHDVFRPERWLPEEEEARKATPSEVLDHVLLRGPFSAGARMCPGSRVATLEVQSIVSRIVQDWRFELQDKSFRNVLDVPFMRSMTVQPHNMPKFVFERRGAINQP